MQWMPETSPSSDETRIFPDRVAFGGDYNPEQWDPATREEDIALMRNANVNMATLGVFAWSTVERERDRFDFGMFRGTMSRLYESGISVCLATMTANPPMWLAAEHPDARAVDVDGRRMTAGSRQWFCPSHPAVRDRMRRLVDEVARQLGSHPAVSSWHIGNEYGNHVAICYCDVSVAAFRAWLQARYTTLDALNQAWGTSFWGQTYSDWGQLDAPYSATWMLNPSHLLDYERFSHDELVGLYQMELGVIRSHGLVQPATTNFFNVTKAIDPSGWADSLDFVSLDSYPDPSDPEAARRQAFEFSLARGTRKGPWMLMEQAAGGTAFRRRNVVKSDDQLRLWSWQAIAHGSAGVMFFQWRASIGGAEQFWSAMVPHGGAASPQYQRVAALGGEFSALDEAVLRSSVTSPIGILLDWDSWRSSERLSNPVGDFDYLDTAYQYFSACWSRGLGIDIVTSRADISSYAAVVVPNLFCVSESLLESLSAYVTSGGTLIIGGMSGQVDATGKILRGEARAAWEHLIGHRTDEIRPLADDIVTAASRETAAALSPRVFVETILPFDATPTAWVEGRPAVFQRRTDTGTVIYIGAGLDADEIALLIADVLPVPHGRVPEIETIERIGPDGQYTFYLNHTSDPVSMRAESGTTYSLDGVVERGQVNIPPFGVMLGSRAIE